MQQIPFRNTFTPLKRSDKKLPALPVAVGKICFHDQVQKGQRLTVNRLLKNNI